MIIRSIEDHDVSSDHQNNVRSLFSTFSIIGSNIAKVEWVYRPWCQPFWGGTTASEMQIGYQLQESQKSKSFNIAIWKKI